MTELWLALLPILLAMLISPVRTISVILLLHTPKGARTAFAYVSGMVTSMMVQGIVLGFLLSVVGLATDSRESDLALVVSVLFVVVGIVMLTGSTKFIFEEEDDDKPPPKWLEQLESLEPRAAFATGFGWLMVSPKQWVFVLTAVAVIFTANLSVAGSLINWFIFSVLIQIFYLLLIAIHLLMPERSEAILDSLFKWLKRNLRVVAIVIFVGFGLFFLIKGLMGLAG